MEHTRARWIARCSLGVVLLAGAAGCAKPPGNSGAVDPQDAGMAGASASATPSPSPTAVVPSRPATSPPRGGVPGRDQAILLQAVDRIEDPVLTVTASGRIGTYPGGADTGEREQFALVPLSPGATVYLLKTARLRVGGEPVCAGIEAGVLHAVACDAAAGAQKVTLVARGADASGAATFEVIVGGYRVEIGKDGKVSLVKAGSAAAKTRFRFIPAGPVGQWP
ncbi:hypothetical protein ACFQO7_05230 [Catellatospora aurea]|uniref:Uncharacterized protein n=1 Tax=Catellatospora aurea TaxID=1337874 RepID=A0ABW2GPA1_9ACTN